MKVNHQFNNYDLLPVEELSPKRRFKLLRKEQHDLIVETENRREACLPPKPGVLARLEELRPLVLDAKAKFVAAGGVVKEDE